MPAFTFTSPQGQSYTVNGPDGATPEQAFQMLQQHLGSQPTSMGEDAAKSVGAGLENTAVGTLGGLGDLREAASRGVDYAGQKLGLDLSPVKSVASAVSNFVPSLAAMKAAPTSADIKSTITDPVVPLDYQPQYLTGSYLKTGAEFAPGMLIGGEGGLGARFLRNVALPAIGSETAGQLTKGTTAEPYARVAGALGGGVAGSLKRGAQAALPSGEDLLKAGSNQFKQAENMDLVVNPSFTQKTAADMRSALKGFDPEAQKPVFNAIDRLEGLGKPNMPPITPAQRLQAEMNWESLPATPPPSPISMNDVELVRKQLSNLRKSPDASIRTAAKTAQEVLTNNQSALAPADVLSGNAPAYAKTMREAVGNYGAGKRSLIVQGKQDLADLNAGTAGSGANIDNATRQAFKQLARPMNNTNVPVAKKLGFNDQEIEAIKNAATGTVPGNIARFLGKAAPTGIVSADLSAHAGGAVGGPLGAVMLPAAGYVAKKIGDLSTKRAVTALDSLVRSRSPLATQVAAQLSPQIVNRLPAKTQRLLQLLATPAIRNQAAQAIGQPIGQTNSH